MSHNVQNSAHPVKCLKTSFRIYIHFVSTVFIFMRCTKY